MSKFNKRNKTPLVTYSEPERDKPKTWNPIDSAAFVKAWMTSTSLAEVAQKMELSKSSAQSKANNLRTKGVKLPKMYPVAADPNSVEELNKLVAKYQKKAQ